MATALSVSMSIIAGRVFVLVVYFAYTVTYVPLMSSGQVRKRPKYDGRV